MSQEKCPTCVFKNVPETNDVCMSCYDFDAKAYKNWKQDPSLPTAGFFAQGSLPGKVTGVSQAQFDAIDAITGAPFVPGLPPAKVSQDGGKTWHDVAPLFVVADDGGTVPDRSDGSTASYYELPTGAKELQDLIAFRNMNAQLGEIFRACYRYGKVPHSPPERDLKKIIFYAQAELDRLAKYGA